MRPKLFLSFFFIWLWVLLSSIVLPLQSKADEATTISNVLGRTVRLDVLCDDFENKNWYYDYQKHVCYRGFWRPTRRGEPELLKRVVTPGGGKSGSTGALEIRTNQNDNDNYSNQEDLLTAEFNQKLGRELTQADQPVFIVRVWLPPSDQWSNGCYNFGFRQTARSSSIPEYYPSIWLAYNRQTNPEPFFVFRIGTGVAYDDVYGGSIKQPGWWTLAFAFDKEGVGHYYAHPGVDNPTEENRIFDTKQFRTQDGTDNPSMDHMGYSFFSLGYPSDDKISPQFVIDDYEVWVIKDEMREDGSKRNTTAF